MNNSAESAQSHEGRGQETGNRQKPEVIFKLFESKWRAKVAGLDMRINVKPLETKHLIEGVGSKLQAIERHQAEEMSGQIKAGEQEPEKVVQSVRQELTMNRSTAQEELKLVGMLDLAFQEFGKEKIFIADKTLDAEGKTISPGFDTRRIGEVENFGETIFVIPDGQGERMKNLLMSLPAMVPEKFNAKAMNFFTPNNFVDEDYGFSIKLGDERVLFLYGELKEGEEDEVEDEEEVETPQRVIH